jgi:hypothetical protein
VGLHPEPWNNYTMLIKINPKTGSVLATMKVDPPSGITSNIVASRSLVYNNQSDIFYSSHTTDAGRSRVRTPTGPQ